MDHKPKKKWTSNRLKEKKKELGIEDKPQVETKDEKPIKKVSKDRKSGDRRSGDRKYGDKRSGDKRSGDKRSGDKRSGDRRSGDRRSGDRRKPYDRNRPKFVIKISNLPSDITVGELARLIGPWGEIGNINIKNYYEAYCSYIDFYNKNEADYFIRALDSTPFDNMIIKVELMKFS